MQVIAVGKPLRDRAKQSKTEQNRGDNQGNRGARRQNRYRDGENSGLQNTAVRWDALIGLTLVALNWMLWGGDCRRWARGCGCCCCCCCCC